ncbi:MAG TPA: globin domain-containing protein [Candidatus Limnocylindrales bacterium]|nr:globin domain-containing protein [Candidatus Limnocylindrales bacterium]
MTPEQKQLVRRSWAELVPMSDATATLFYERLFSIDPPARRLFGTKDMKVQGTLFMQMLSVFVRSLDDPASMEAALERCGLRHVGYGVLASDYDGVGRALLWAVEQVLRDRFTPDVRDAWAEGYRSLAATMQGGVPA